MTINSSDLTEFSARLLEAGGYTPAEAAATAELLVWANLRGIDSHGVLRIPRYLEMVQSGAIRCGQSPTVIRETGAICVIDFAKAPGAVAMTQAAAKAADLAGQFGIGWCGARAISHAGAIGFFTTQVAERGLVGIAMTASKPLMSYFGAKGEALSTNPLSTIMFLDITGSHIIDDSITSNIIQSVFFHNILAVPSNNNSELDFPIDFLTNSGNTDCIIRPDN